MTIKRCTSISENDIVNDWSKHVDIKYQKEMDNVKSGTVKLKYVQTGKMVADIMTKLMNYDLHCLLSESIGMGETLYLPGYLAGGVLLVNNAYGILPRIRLHNTTIRILRK